MPASLWRHYSHNMKAGLKMDAMEESRQLGCPPGPGVPIFGSKVRLFCAVRRVGDFCFFGPTLGYDGEFVEALFPQYERWAQDGCHGGEPAVSLSSWLGSPNFRL